MKKLIVLLVIFAMTFSANVLAAVQKATLINSNGDKVVVAVNSSEAQYYFSEGYKLMESVGVAVSDVYNDTRFHGSVITGGKYTNASTSMNVAMSLTAKQVCESSVISVNSAAGATSVAAASLDITLPATSTLFSTCLKEPGSKVRFLFANLSPTAATTTQIVAGAGEDLLEPDEGDDFNVEIGGGNRAYIEITRMPLGFESGLDAIVTVTEYSAAD